MFHFESEEMYTRAYIYAKRFGSKVIKQSTKTVKQVVVNDSNKIKITKVPEVPADFKVQKSYFKILINLLCC